MCAWPQTGALVIRYRAYFVRRLQGGGTGGAPGLLRRAGGALP